MYRVQTLLCLQSGMRSLHSLLAVGMGTVAVHHPVYGSRIRHTDTVPYEPLEELSTVRVAARLIPYNDPYGSGQNSRMYGIYQKCLILTIDLLSLA